ncbi:MAG: DUF2520 domain-containing protein [Actinobacteria bacterium]|nr:DUF2520 domain-containing protein [Actinomycetota bacterium]
MTRSVCVIGAGRAGGSFVGALAALGVEAGWAVDGPVGRDPEAIAAAAQDVDLVLICTADAAVPDIAAQIRPNPEAVIAHVSGALPLTVLAPHERVASLHPVMSLPNPELGAHRLRGGWFATAGDAMVRDLAAALGGRTFEVADEHRAVHHAAACVAANHVVALLGQVERLAAAVGAPLDAYLEMTADVVENVRSLGAAAALTGPAARGDEATIERHLAAIDPSERATYLALVREARRLAGRTTDRADSQT